MPELGEIWISVKGKKRDLDLTLDDAKNDAKKKGGEAANLYAAEFNSKLRAAQKTIQAAFKAAIGGYGAYQIGREVIDATRDLEDALAKVKVNAGATSDEMKNVARTADNLADRHRDLGKTTSDYAKAMLEGVWAGQKLDEAMKSAESSINLAGAAQMDVAASSQVVANAMNVFNIKADESAKITDVLAVAQGKASGSLEDLTRGFQQGSAIAAQAGLTIEDLSAALGLMANNGVLGSDAGTSLKSMLLQIMAPSKQASGYIKELGLDFYDATGHMRPFGEIIDSLNKKMSNLTEKQKNKVLGDIFGSDGIRAALVMMKEGKKAFDDFKVGMDKSGEASKLASGNIGDMTRMTNELKVEFDKFVRDSGKDVVQLFKDLLGTAKDVLKTWRDLDPQTKHAITQWGLYALALGPVVSKLAEIYKFGKLIKEGALLSGAASAAGSAGAGGAAAGAAGLGSAAWPAAAVLGSYVIWDDWTTQLKVGEEGIKKGNEWERQNKEAIRKILLQKLVKFNGDFDKAAAEVYKENEKTYGNGPQPLKDALSGYKWEFGQSKNDWLTEARNYVSDLQEQRVNQARFKKSSSSTTASTNNNPNIDADGNLIKPDKEKTKELTRNLLKEMADSISTPSGQASCAFFASQLLNKTGVAVGKIGGAKALIDAVMSGGGSKVDRKDAKAGDLIYYYGTGYGSKEAGDFDPNTPGRQGYHVGVYAGDGYVVDSSGGRKRLNNTVHSGAQFIRPKRTGEFDNTGAMALDSLEYWATVQEQVQKEQQRLIDSIQPLRRLQNLKKSNDLKAAGGMRYDVVSMREFGKMFFDLTDEANKNKVRGIAQDEAYSDLTAEQNKNTKSFLDKWVDNINAANDRVKAKDRERDAVKNFTNELERQLNKEQELSSVGMVLQEIKRRGLKVTGEELDKLMALAQAKDDQIKADKEQAKIDAAQAKINDAKTRGLEQYSEAMRDLADRSTMLGRSTEVNEFRLQKFALSFSGGNEELAKTAEALSKAKQYMMDLAKVEDLERLRSMFDQVADSMVSPIKDSFLDLIRVDMPDFLRDFSSLIDNALRDIANKVLEYQIKLQLNNFIGGVFGKVFGATLGGLSGGASTTGADTGIFIASKTANQAQPQSDAGVTNIYLTINATDGPSVVSSLDQISAGLAGQISEAKRKF